jgi:hypothetical protein
MIVPEINGGGPSPEISSNEIQKIISDVITLFNVNVVGDFEGDALILLKCKIHFIKCEIKACSFNSFASFDN